ncbi:MAG: C10 family peptidase [Armatimonadetes bacterium]|nr:C10 family peptidase [Armatimonadota bacterium]
MRWITVHLALFLCAVLASVSLATPVTEEDARAAAERWVALIIRADGGWCGTKSAQVEQVSALMRHGRVIGYYCSVSPIGYVIVSRYKELAPVKAFSAHDNLDPTLEEGMADLIKGQMDAALDKLEAAVGKPELERPEGPSVSPPVDHRPMWKKLMTAQAVPAGESTSEDTLTYAGGEVLLTSEWDQGFPWNNQCPAGDTCAHTWVGCIATAGAQIMYHYAWPPYGVGSPYNDSYYDWPNMLDTYEGPMFLQPQIDAVAELSYEAAIAASMTFGCDVSLSNLDKMQSGFHDHLSYYGTRIDRDDYDADYWFQYLQTQFDVYMPVQYSFSIPGKPYGHSIVGDGWRQIGSTRYIHFNYGWGTSNDNTWYLLDDPELGPIGDQKALVFIYPHTSLGWTLNGTYARDAAFPYRYFDRDTFSLSNVVFEAGQMLNALARIKISAGATANPGITFNGTSSLVTKIYSRGDPTKGVKISSGALRLSNGGSLVLRPLGPPCYVRGLDRSIPPNDYQTWVGWEKGYGTCDGYVIERSDNFPGLWNQVAIVASDRRDWWDFNVQPNRQYFYRIRAYRGEGFSDWSREVSAGTPM